MSDFETLDSVHEDFSVYWADEKTADVKIESNRALIKRYSNSPIKQIFASDNISLYELGEILRSRCWEENRENLEKYLQKMGLSEFNPYEICRKTHGVMFQDKIWFKYKNENISWNDVKWK